MTTGRTPRPSWRARRRAWFRDATPRQWFRRALLAFVGAVVVALALLLLAYSSVSLPARPEQLQTTIVTDARGGTLAELFKDENRIDVPLHRVADVMERAVVSTEDRHFYEHSGIDPIGIGRALVNDLRGGNVQGGSTITQQLVKNTYLTSERSLKRKVKEAILAVKVERQLGKRQILERYLNTVYFGRGAYGVEKAAGNYFDKPAAQLDLPEAALLAGLIRAPESADPATHPDAARNRRAIVLDAMVRSEAISRAEADAAKAAPLPTKERPDPTKKLTGSSAHFVAMVRRWAIGRYGERVAFGGGLRIETTLDPKLQADAEKAVFGTLDRPEDPDAALVSMTDEGAVVALIGGKNFQESQLNLATNNVRPQAGSTFKPFVLAAALENDIPVTQQYPGPSKLDLDFDGFAPKKEPWTNYGNESFGRIDLTQATAHSVNTAYIQLAHDVGLDQVAKAAHELGINTQFPVVPAMALGSANVSPYEMLRSYMTFANRGQRIDPFFVRKVSGPDGKVLYEAAPRRTDVYPEKYADLVNHVLTQVVKRGTGTAAAIGKPAAGKTGTTSGNTDAWFVGYTPKIGTAVWMGYKDHTGEKMNRVHGRAVTGGSFPAQIWQRFMKAATAGMDTGDFAPPDKDLLNAPQNRDLGGGGSDQPDSGEKQRHDATTSTTESTTTTVGDGTTTTTSEPGGPTTTTSSPTASTTTTAPPPTTTTTRPKGPTTTAAPG